MTANTFGLAINTVTGVILEVCKAICEVLGPSYICMPRNKDLMKHKVAEFESKFGMPQAFDCIDEHTFHGKGMLKIPRIFTTTKGSFHLTCKQFVISEDSSWT